MISKINKKNITWININRPTEEDVSNFKQEFLINDLVARDILLPTIRPHFTSYDNYSYIVQHFPRLASDKDIKRRYEVDFILGKNWIATITYDNIDHIINFESVIDDVMRDESHGFYDVGYIYARMVNDFYDKCNSRLDQIDSELDNIEREIYKNREKNMLKMLSLQMRKIIDFEHSLNMHETILKKISEYGVEVYDKRFADLMIKNIDTLKEMFSRLKFVKSAIIHFQNTNDSLLQHKTADAMKTLTMMSFVIFPLSLIAGIFGMNAENMPIIGNHNDFWNIITLMFIVTVSLFAYFKIKKWL